MKVLHLSKRDIKGGAACATYRLHTELRELNIESKMLVQIKDSNDPDVSEPKNFITKLLSRIRTKLDSLPLKLYQKNKGVFSVNLIPDRLIHRIEKVNPEIVHLHWVAGGFLHPKSLKKINSSIVWTFHDMWPFTGGCHYSGNCKKYTEICGSCPKLNSNREKDISRLVWNKKYINWLDLDLTIVTPSTWLSDCVEQSSIFENKDIKTIPNGVDIRKYSPKKEIRNNLRKFNILKNENIILFGGNALNPRKGFGDLKKALKFLETSSRFINNTSIVIFGNNDLTDHLFFNQSEFTFNNLGYIDDDILPNLYSLSDVTILPSKQDNLPNIVLEALSSGCPCIAYDIGGMSDMIEHKKNGYLAKPYEPKDLARGIKWILNEKSENLSVNARNKVKNNFKIEKVANQYIDLYKNIL